MQLNFLSCLLPHNHWSSQKLKGYGWHWHFLSLKWRESMEKRIPLKFSYLSQSRRLLSEISCWNGGREKPVASSDGWMCSDKKSLSGPLYQANESCPWRGGSMPLVWALAFTVQRWMMVKQSLSLTSTGNGKVQLLLQAAGGTIIWVILIAFVGCLAELNALYFYLDIKSLQYILVACSLVFARFLKF